MKISRAPRTQGSTVNVVVTCSLRKRETVVPTLMVRDLARCESHERSTEWARRVGLAPQAECVRAVDLYKGEHWSVVRSIYAHSWPAQTRRVQLWIMSAGCGLLAPATLVPAYNATFTSGDQDSVANTSRARRSWWKTVCEIPLEGSSSSPRTLTQLATRYPDAPLIVTASPGYLDAAADDLSTAARNMNNPELLTLLCRKGSLPGLLDAHKVHLSSHMRAALGGTLLAMNVRMLLVLLQGGGNLNKPHLDEQVDRFRSTCVPSVPRSGCKVSDVAVGEYISQRLASGTRLSASEALRGFRETGSAVEQKRFQKLFRTIRDEVTCA